MIQSGSCSATSSQTKSSSSISNSTQITQNSPGSISTVDSQTIKQTSQITTQINQNTGGGALVVTSDAYCKTFNSNTRVCSECYYGYYFNNQSGFCVPVNPQCKSWNSQGHCLSCYSGYEISGTQCVVNFFSNSQASSNSQTSLPTNSNN